MNRRTWLTAAVLSLASCGGGGVGVPDLAAVVEVTFGETGEKSGLTYLDDGPTRIVLADWLRDFPNPQYLQHVLRHEVFHAVTRIREHPSDVMCVSADDRSPYDGTLDKPCPWERDEMRAGTPIRLRFAGYEDEAWDAAYWWNNAILSVMVEVAE